MLFTFEYFIRSIIYFLYIIYFIYYNFCSHVKSTFRICFYKVLFHLSLMSFSMYNNPYCIRFLARPNASQMLKLFFYTVHKDKVTFNSPFLGSHAPAFLIRTPVVDMRIVWVKVLARYVHRSTMTDYPALSHWSGMHEFCVIVVALYLVC